MLGAYGRGWTVADTEEGVQSKKGEKRGRKEAGPGLLPQSQQLE